MAKDSKNKYQLVIFFIAFLLLCIFVIFKYFPRDIFVTGDDAYFHLKRFQAINDAVRNGSFPFYIDSDSLNGYGYATNLFYPDFMLVPFALLIDFLGLVMSFKIMLVFYSFLCGVLSYYSVKKVSGNNWIALIFALLYTFSYYRLADMSFRTALGEYLAFTFIPLVFWGTYEILYGSVKKWYILSIAFACLLLCHLVSTLIVFLVLVCMLIIYYKPLFDCPKKIWYFLLSGVVSVLLSAVFLFPMFEQMWSNDFYFEVYPYVQNIKYSALSLKVVLLAFVKEFAVHSTERYTYVGIGLILTVLLLSRIFIKNKNRSNLLKTADIFTIVGLVMMFMITKWFLWDIIPFNKLKIIQFPWRFLQVITFLFSFSCAVYLFSLINTISPKFRKRTYVLSVSLIIILIPLFTIYISTEFKKSRGYNPITKSGGYYKDGSLKTSFYLGVGLEYIPAAVPSLDYVENRGDKIVSHNGSTLITDLERNYPVLSFNVETKGDDQLVLPLLYYKGYVAKENGKDLAVRQSDDGLVQVSVSQSGEVRVYYAGTLLQRISLLLSVLTLILMCIYIYSPALRKSLKRA
ncbi:MAG: hypothetical protein ACLVKO_12765 [Dysgonomonas sp.]